jgi:cytochrome c5
LTVLVNFFMTIRQSWDRVAYNTPLKYLVAGNIYYLLTCVQGPFQASRGINWYIHFTQWVVGHAHLALLGTFTFIQMSAIYYALPRILKRPIYSERLANVQFWLMVIGFSVMLAVLTIAGLIQGATWAAGVPVAFTGVLLRPYFFIRSLSGVALVFAFGLFAYNVLQTWREARAEVGSTTPSQHGSATPSQPAEERQIGLDPQANPPRDEAFWSPQAPAEYVKMAARAKSQAPKEHGAAEEPAFEPRFITNGRGIFLEKCAVCHGPEGKGDGPAGRHLVKRPANFWEPRFKTYSDAMWLWRVSEGVPGTNMPIWKLSLTEQQCWYLVIFLKYLAKQSPGEPPVDTFTTEEFIQDTEKVWQSLLPLDKSVFPKEKAEGETAAAQGPAKAQVGGETASTAQEPDGESETEKAAPERLRQEE